MGRDLFADHWALRWAFTIYFAVAPLMTLQGQTTFFNELPDPAQVVQRTRGTDDVDTAARQVGTLRVLHDIVNWRTMRPGPEGTIPPEARDAAVAQMEKYERAAKAIGDNAWQRLDPAGRYKLNHLIEEDYHFGWLYWSQEPTPFQREVLDRFFSPAWKKDFEMWRRYDRRKAESERLQGERFANNIYGGAGVVCFVLGLIVRYWIGKAQFDRFNQFGVMEFDSYGSAVVTRAKWSLAGLLSWALILGGIGMVLSAGIHSRALH